MNIAKGIKIFYVTIGNFSLFGSTLSLIFIENFRKLCNTDVSFFCFTSITWGRWKVNPLFDEIIFYRSAMAYK